MPTNKLAPAVLAIAVSLAITASPSIAVADTVRYGAVEVQTPDDGWSVRTENGMMTIGLEKGGAVVEMYNFSKVPAADKDALAKLVGGRKETTNVVVTSVTPKHAQNGLDGIAFRGTATVVGKSVAFTAIALGGINGRAVVAIAIVRNDLAAARQREVADVLASVKKSP